MVNLEDYKDYAVCVCGDGGAHYFKLKEFLLIMSEGGRWSWPGEEEYESAVEFKDIKFKKAVFDNLKEDIANKKTNTYFPHGSVVLFYFDPFTGKQIPWNDILNQLTIS